MTPQQRLVIRPLTLAQANALVEALHRHHKRVQGHRFSIGVYGDDGLCHGACIIGRPVARRTDQNAICEVTRLVTDGTPNACSALYGAAARAAKALGFVRIQTFILESESGTSLRAAGWRYDGDTPGKSWSVPSRERVDKTMLAKRHRYVRDLA